MIETSPVIVFGFIFALNVSLACAQPQLDAYWAMDGSLNDGSDHGLNGTYQTADQAGQAAFSPGVFGDSFDNSSQKGIAAFDYQLPNKGTILFWYFLKPYYNYQTLFDTSGGEENWEMWVYDTGLLRFHNDADNSATVEYRFHPRADANEWHHIALSWDQDDQSDQAVRLYVDGSLRDSSGWNYPKWKWVEPGKIFYLGGGMNKHGNGKWDDVAVYRDVLQEDRINMLAYNGAGIYKAFGNSHTRIVAHRGASFEAPENTMAAFQLAWKENADSIEGDYHLSKDGKIACMHDANAKRTTGRDAPVKDLTLAELKQLDAGLWKDRKWKGEPIPTLDEVLQCVPKNKATLIEIKCGPEIVPTLKTVLDTCGLDRSRLTVISFNLDVVAEVKKQIDGVKAFFLSGTKLNSETGNLEPPIEELIAKATQNNLDGLDLGYSDGLDKDAVDRIRAADLEFHVWTVDDPGAALRMISLGVDSITTNRPGWLRQQVGLKQQP